MNSLKGCAINHLAHSVTFLSRTRLGPVEELPPDFEVLAFPPHDGRAMWTYATCGMSLPNDLHPLRDAGIIGQCAIGGAMGATFYLEPISTYDLDIFVLFENPPLILTLTPIYEFLEKRGHVPEGDAIVIHGWPVQFLPAESLLLTEAVQQAVAVDFEGVPTRVMTAEHLMAIALQTGRAKDFSRLLAFIESGVVDEVALADILNRHRLVDAWSRFKQNLSAKPMSPLTTQMLEQKRQRRQTLAQLPFPEKVRIVEKLRDASLRIAAAAQQQGLRQNPRSRPSAQSLSTGITTEPDEHTMNDIPVQPSP